ncbi:hypothetical protein GEMRC1_004564 [Eukaryota sp. GEM-RC1]
MQRLQEVEEEDPGSDELICQGYQRRVYGIPCAHELLQVRKRLSLEAFHNHWCLECDASEQQDDEEDVIDILYKNWTSYTAVQKMRTRKHLEQALQSISEPLLPPAANTSIDEPKDHGIQNKEVVPKKKAVCKNCLLLGHFQKTCKAPCGKCKQVGHLRKDCPRNIRSA